MRRNNLRLIQFITNMVVFIRNDRIDSKDTSKKKRVNSLPIAIHPLTK